MAKLIINEFGDICAISKLLNILSSSTCGTQKSKPVHSGSGSKLSGKQGFTAYHFITDKEVNGKGYLFKSLKRLIEENLVESVQRIQQTKDLKGFVFDLPSEHDKAFQGNWRDGKFDSMQLLDGEIPELNDSNDVGRARGGFRGRGNDRGGYRGRGNDRGGNRGRMNDRGGRAAKRYGSSFETGNSKLVKFD